ncbi:MAG: hypothetical protein IKE20_07185, partial [Eggerthellaceae bacterium]|nr:hypothetical protein [Eggerthellaceae bacterium]
MSYRSLKSELQAALGRSQAEAVISKYKKLASEIDASGLKPHHIFSVLELYKSLCEAVDLDLENYKASLDSARAEANGIKSDEQSAARTRRDDDVKRAEDARSSKLSDLARISGDFTKSMRDAQEAIEKSTKNFNSLGWFDKKRSEKSYQAEIAQLTATIESCRQKILGTDQAKEAAKSYCAKQVEEINAAYSKRAAEIANECQSTLEDCAKMERERRESLMHTAKMFLESFIGKDQLDQYSAGIEAMRPNYEDYRPVSIDSFKEPSEFYLGFARWRSKGGRLLPTVSRSYIASDASSQFLVGLPYSIDLAGGMQLLIRPTGANDAFWDNDCVRALTLRLLMAYPPGKLQLTLIDSFKNGISFSGIPDIVDKHHESIISGGVLTETEYIAQALRSLRTKMGNYSGDQGYGRDKASYFEREPVQAVIINDFPNGFTADSLADLARLMENGEAFGMVFIIGMNPTYEADFINNANYKAILSRSEVISLTGEQPSCLMYNDTPFELAFGDEVEVIKNGDSIIKAMREGVMTSRARKEHFAQLFPNPTDWQDENAWRRAESTTGVMIPLGVSGASKITQINVGMPGANTMHHGLIIGPTGAGKSTALHTMIMSILLNYPPDEVQLVLIDFKEGTEFRSYAPYKIPNFRSITTTTEPEFALAALEDVKDLYEKRASMMTDLLEYRADNDAAIPQVLIIFDEVQALFADGVREDIKNKCLEILTLLVTKGRAMGIHVFLASQSFERVSCIQPLMSDMKIRLCLKDTDTGGILQDATALRDAPAGSAILNNQGGAADKNDLFQVCMLEDDERDELLGKLSDIYSAPGMEERYKSFDPRLLFTNIEDDFHHPMNEFIETGNRPIAHDTDPLLRIGSLLKVEGNSVPYKDTGRPFNIPLEGENILFIGDNSSVAKSMFIFSMLSISLDSLSRRSRFK